MHDLYKNVFTENELDELSSFYKTTLGQKVINQMPILHSKGMQMIMRKSSELELRTKQIGDEFVEKLKQIRKDK